jgi:predicted DCC family thiol-disulfide oxidoreductase YuxK
MTGRERPVLVYDGDCGFCTSSVRFIERRIPTAAEIVAFPFAELDALGTTAERAEYEVLWVDRSGRVTGGAQAIARLLMDAGGVWWPLGAVMRVPPLRWIAHGVYRLVANNRHRMPGGTAACMLPAAQRPGADRRA